ncbi:hypothetical protein E2C01_027059 [Portunus trituberculatus]|uniref:Uncharacterized protein n=1 Tax=Portunus trituberculatus TaxID=210409 RepID=A0A5B7EGX7_PORTR|nr:hypothetical protein [Portunus trituberculatus]
MLQNTIQSDTAPGKKSSPLIIPPSHTLYISLHFLSYTSSFSSSIPSYPPPLPPSPSSPITPSHIPHSDRHPGDNTGQYKCKIEERRWPVFP